MKATTSLALLFSALLIGGTAFADEGGLAGALDRDHDGSVLDNVGDDSTQGVREELEVIEDDRQAPADDDGGISIAGLCGGDEACVEAMRGHDEDGNGSLRAREIEGVNYGDILINGEPIDIE